MGEGKVRVGQVPAETHRLRTTSPWIEDADLSRWCSLRAAAGLDISRSSSIAVPTPKRVHAAALKAYMGQAHLFVDEAGLQFGAQDPREWHSNWDVVTAMDGGRAGVQDVSHLTFGGGSLSAGLRIEATKAVLGSIERPLALDIDGDLDRLASSLEFNLMSAASFDNGTWEGYSPVAPWFGHGSRIDLPAGGGDWLRGSGRLNQLAQRSAPDAVGIDLSGGRGLDSQLVVQGDVVFLHEPGWPTRPESGRQRTRRAALQALEQLVRGAEGDRPDITAAARSWRGAVSSELSRPPSEVAVSVIDNSDPGPSLPLGPGGEVPVALVVRGPFAASDEAEGFFSGLATKALSWTTARHKLWRWRVMRTRAHNEVWYHVGPYLDLSGDHPIAAYGDCFEIAAGGAVLPKTVPGTLPAWKVSWRPRHGAWIADLTAVTKLGGRIEHGDELVSYLLALAWLIRETTPDASIDVVWLRT